ncbi:type II secretion system F family protein [Elusimicrobiota bacterium]
MAVFRYLANSKQGAAIEGEVVAESLDVAIEKLQGKGYLILTVEEQTRFHRVDLFSRGGASARDLIEFTRNLGTLIKGGVPLTGGLKILSRRAPNLVVRKALKSVTKEVTTGVGLSKALSRHPDIFPMLVVALVKVGETSGTLVDNLKHLAYYLTRQESTRRKVVGALAYPVLVMSFSMLVALFLCGFVVPQFEKILVATGGELPLSTQFVLAISLNLRAYYVHLIIILIVAWAFLRSYLDSDEGRTLRMRVLLGVPFFGELINHFLLERFFDAMGLLIKSGTALLHALGVMKDVFGDNPIYAQGLGKVSTLLVKGEPFADSLETMGVMPEMDLETIRVGEESGAIVQCMEALAEGHREQIEYLTGLIATVIEPVMVISVGAMVAFIMFSLFMPMIELTQMRPF